MLIVIRAALASNMAPTVATICIWLRRIAILMTHSVSQRHVERFIRRTPSGLGHTTATWLGQSLKLRAVYLLFSKDFSEDSEPE